MRSRVMSVLIAAALIASACAGREAREPVNPTTELRLVGAFTSLVVGNAIVVEAKVGMPQSVAVTADSDDIARVTTRVEGGRLLIAIDGSVAVDHLVRVEVVAPTIEAVEAATSSRVTLNAVEAESFTVIAASSASVRASGRANHLRLTATASAHTDLTHLRAETVEVDVGTSARAEIAPSQTVVGTVHESGTVRIVGDPRRIEVEESSSGRVVRD